MFGGEYPVAEEEQPPEDTAKVEHRSVHIGHTMRTASDKSTTLEEGTEYQANMQQRCRWCARKLGRNRKTSFKCICHPEAFFCRECMPHHITEGMPEKTTKRARGA